MTAPRLLYLDQNAWIALARGAWDAAAWPTEHAALTRVIRALQAGRILTPLSFTNIYETAKINDPVRRTHLAGVQSSLSGGKVFRGRRRILQDTLLQRLAGRSGIAAPHLPEHWFLSDLWFEAAADYSAETYGFEISTSALDVIRRESGFALFSYLAESDEVIRLEGVRRYSASSAELIRTLEARRALVAGEPFAARRRIYADRLLEDERAFILTIGEQLGLPGSAAGALDPSLTKGLVAEIPALNVECELVVRLEDQTRDTNENDLRDMAAFTTALPFADIFVAEKAFVNLSRQARLDRAYSTTLLTNITALTDNMI
jgi:hypothetical protein